MRTSWNKGLKGKKVSHGYCNHRLYKTWHGMMDRCYKKSNKDFERYGDRGIRVHKSWHDVRNFIHDMSPTHKEGLSLDRINNNDSYSKKNCRWATVHQQHTNTRKNRYITYGGKTLTIADWARVIGTSRQTIRNRLESGWSIKSIIEVKVDYSNRNVT